MNLTREATKLLREAGYSANGTPLNEKRQKQIRYSTVSPSRLASLREVPEVGGGIHQAVAGSSVKRIRDHAADLNDNELTLVHHLTEDSG